MEVSEQNRSEQEKETDLFYGDDCSICERRSIIDNYTVFSNVATKMLKGHINVVSATTSLQ